MKGIVLSNPTKRVALIVTHLSHYRKNVYELLHAELDQGLRLYGSLEASDGIKAIDGPSLQFAANVNFVQLGPFRWQRGVLSLPRDPNIDLFIVLGDFRVLSTWLLIARAKRSNRSVLLWTQGWRKKDPWIIRPIRRAFYNMADALLLYSVRGRELALSQGMKSSKLFVIGNSTETREMVEKRPLRLEFPLKSTLVVGAVSRITSAKNYELLIEAAVIARERGLTVIIRLAGPVMDGGVLERMALKEEVELELLGAIYGDNALSDYYATLDLSVVPRNIGLTVVQSMSFGVPVAAGCNPDLHYPEVEAIRPGETGFLFNDGDASDLANLFLHFSTLSEVARMRLAKESRAEVLKRWTADSQAERILEALERLS